MSIVNFPAKRTKGPFADYRPDAWRRALAWEGGNAERARFWLDLIDLVLTESEKPRRRDAQTARARMASLAAAKQARDAGASQRELIIAMVTASVSVKSGIPVHLLAGAADDLVSS